MVMVHALGVPAVTRSGRLAPSETVKFSSCASLSCRVRICANPYERPARTVTDDGPE